MPKPPTISQNIFDRGNKNSRVVFQLQKNPTDFELNEIQDILGGFVEDTAKFLGGFGFLGDAFLVEPTGNPGEVTVRPGVFLTGDKVVVHKEEILISGLPLPVTNVEEFVYAIITEEYEDSIDRPEIKDPITGSEKALRLAYVLEVGVTFGGVFPTVGAENDLIIFAKLNRRGADNSVLSSDVLDFRENYALNYINSTGPDAYAITGTTGNSVDLEGGEAFIYGTVQTSTPATRVLTLNALNFVYLNATGGIVASTTRPVGVHLELYRITVSSLGVITNIQDVRRWRPGGLAGIAFAEVVSARGTRVSLDARLDESLEEDGSIKRCVVPKAALEDLCPSETSPPSLFVDVDAGSVNLTEENIQVAGAQVGPFPIPTTNPRIDLIYVNNTGTLTFELGAEAVSPVAPTHAGRIPVAEISLDPLDSVVTVANITDVRPLFALDPNVATTALSSKFKEIQDQSTMRNYLVEEFISSANINGISTGTLVPPNSYVLDPGEFVQSLFPIPAPGAPPTVDSIIPAVLFNTVTDPDDVLIEVDRGGGFETVEASHVEHVFTGGGTANLQIKITNVGAGVLDLSGYAVFFEKTTVSSVAPKEESGLIKDIGGARLFVTNPHAFSYAASLNFGFNWNSALGGGTLSWGAASPPGPVDLQMDVVDPEGGTFTATLANPGSLAAIAVGDHVYFDIDRTSSPVTLAISSGGPPSMRKDRCLLGRRDGIVFNLSCGTVIPDQASLGYPFVVQTPFLPFSNEAWSRVHQTGDVIATLVATAGGFGSSVFALLPTAKNIEILIGASGIGGEFMVGRWIITTPNNLIFGFRHSNLFITDTADAGPATTTPRTLVSAALDSAALSAYAFTAGVGGSMTISNSVTCVTHILVVQRA